MATVNKDFRVKHGLVVEGTNATVDGSDIITEDSILAGNGEGGNQNVTVSYDPETKKVTFEAAPGYSDQDVKDVLTGSAQTNISITEVGGVLTITAENGVADATTDDLDEGVTNLYFTNQRALDATSAAYDPAGAAAQALTDAEDYADGLATNYEPAGAVSTHSDLTTGVHGVDGDVVGTTDTQDLSNKRIVDSLQFTDGVTVGNEAEIAVKPTTHEFEIKANLGNLDLKAVAVEANVNITAADGDIILNADGDSYLGTATAGNEIATKSDIDALDTDDIEEGATSLYYTDARARDAVSAGDGLDYDSNSGIFSADLGTGLQIDGTGQIEIDNNVVATQTDLSDDIGAHSDLTTGVHGVSGNVVGTDDVQTLENKSLGSGTILSASIDADGYTITNLGTPDQASDAATKGYVDSVAEGLHVHESAVAATTANINLTTGGLLVIDTVQLVADDRVLVKNQSTTSQNGIYLAKVGAWVRADDYNSSAEIQGGDFTFVTGGDLYENTGWVQTATVTTVGSDPILFSQFSGSGVFTAGNGLQLDGTEFSIDTTITATTSYVDGAIDDHVELTDNVHGVTGSVVGTSDTQTLTNKTLGTGTVLGANLDATNTYKVTNLVDPSSGQDAATKNYVDTNFVSAEDLPGELDDYVPLTQKGSADGVATLDAGAQVPLNQLENVTDIIDGLTTADITEGTNLYFTDTRAVDALEAVVPNFTAVDINNVAKEVAVSGIPTAGSPTAVLSWDSATFPSLKAIVMFRTSTHTEISEILLTMDSSNNFAVTEYAVVGTNGTLGTIEPEYYGAESGSALKATTVNSGTTVTIKATLLNPYTV